MDPRTATANISTLAEISVQLAISGAKNAKALIENLLGNTTPSREPLQNCLSSYVNITGHFENALSGLSAGLQSSHFDIAGVLDLVKICELELTKNQTHILQLTNRNHYTRMFVEISEFLITRLELYHIGNGFTQPRTPG
jgi:pectinesterase inhibitor-like protein